MRNYLTKAQSTMLRLIAQASKDGLYWIPRVRPEVIERHSVSVSGAAAANAWYALVRRGLIETVPGIHIHFAARTTGSGEIAAQRERGRPLLWATSHDAEDAKERARVAAEDAEAEASAPVAPPQPPPPLPERTVATYSDSSLLERAVRCAGHGVPLAPRWVHVMRTFALGATFASQLCTRFGVDPDEETGVSEESEEGQHADV